MPHKKTFKRKPKRRVKKVFRRKTAPRKSRFKKTNTYRHTCKSTNDESIWQSPESLKFGDLTNNLSGLGTDLKETLSDNADVNALKQVFRTSRIEAIRITLIPEQWNAATLNTSGGIQDGEKPYINWFNDDGTINIATGQSNTIQVDDCEMMEGFHSTPFTKKMTFTIRPVWKQTPSLTQPTKFSMNTWVRSSTAETFLSNQSFMWGVSVNTPSNFKYRVLYEYDMVFKDYQNTIA